MSLLLDADPFQASLDVDRLRSSGIRTAHTKPAFTSQPSLPSLHTLAQMNMSMPSRKVRRGTPGARLPHEPWDMDLNTELNLVAGNTPPLEHFHPPHEPTEPIALASSGKTETCFTFREVATSSNLVLQVVDETSSSRSSSGDDAEIDSLPSLSYTPSESEPSSSTLSRFSSIASSPKDSMHVICSNDIHVIPGEGNLAEEDPLSYHSDFDYYTQSLSDLSDSDLDPGLTTGENTTLHSPRDAAVTPPSSVYDPAVDFLHQTCPDTMRPPTHPPQSDPHLIASLNFNSPQVAIKSPSQPTVPERQSGRKDEARGREVFRHNGASQSSRIYSGGVGGGDDNNGDKPCRANPRSSISSSSDCTSSSADDADGITVYYSLDGMSNGTRSRTHSRTCSHYSKAGAGSDDDVPLAQRVPTALSAQKSIRRQLHDERQQRKLQRAKSSRAAADPRSPSRPTEPGRAPAVPTSSRKRSTSVAPSPGSGSRTVPVEPFAVEDLTRKLVNLQTSSHTPPLTTPLTYDGSMATSYPSWMPGYSNGISRSSSRGRNPDQTTYLQQKSPRIPEPLPQDRPLRSMRSFHRPDGRHSEAQRQSTEQTSAPRIGRSTTTATASRSTRAGHDIAPTGYEHHAKSGRISEDGRKPSASVPRSSMDREADLAQRVAQRPPIPPLPTSDATPPQPTPRVPVVQQRIFIGDMQRFNIVEITPATNARNVVETVASQGMLDKSGSWMLFEMAQDYGMERPVREYELLADVSASWNKDKLLNAFVIKQTPLAQPLSRSALPTSSPTHRGWVEWESKRGKWSKRWMELREHGLWLSKRDTGKDEVFLCSLSNFDAYFVTRRHKSPKPFAFAIKSTDHPSLFENAADYLHVFSCNPKDGEQWMQVILVARSYVLYQERHVLFAKNTESLSQVKPLTRSRTRKQSISNRPAQPLVTVPPPFSQSPSANVAFEPGSLLAKRKGDA